MQESKFSLPRRAPRIAGVKRSVQFWTFITARSGCMQTGATIAEFDRIDKPFIGRQVFSAFIYAAILIWINAYICHELFTIQTAPMNSMHGFWVALAKRGGPSWMHSNWWPFWDGGIPIEFTYAPLIPWLISAWSAIRGITPELAFQSVTGFVYCLAPLTLFLMAWLMTRAPGCSFLAALFCSLRVCGDNRAAQGGSQLRGGLVSGRREQLGLDGPGALLVQRRGRIHDQPCSREIDLSSSERGERRGQPPRQCYGQVAPPGR